MDALEALQALVDNEKVELTRASKDWKALKVSQDAKMKILAKA